MSQTVYNCRWGWICRDNFSSCQQLVKHVIEDHVNTSQPLSLRELELEAKADGSGESFSSLNLPKSSQKSSQDSQKIKENSQATASLPSPPLSNISPQRERSVVDTEASDEDDSPTKFKSFRSPTSSPIPSLPGSPPLTQLVLGKRKKPRSQAFHSDSPNKKVRTEGESQRSLDSQASHDSVERILTQESDDEPLSSTNDGYEPSATTSYLMSQPHATQSDEGRHHPSSSEVPQVRNSSQSPSHGMNFHNFNPIRTSTQRQPWYESSEFLFNQTSHVEYYISSTQPPPRFRTPTHHPIGGSALSIDPKSLQSSPVGYGSGDDLSQSQVSQIGWSQIPSHGEYPALQSQAPYYTQNY